jgi:uncharacterized MnhB-related membrane protein
VLHVIQLILLMLVGLGGLGVVRTRDPLRQTVVLSFYGLLMALLFFVLQAPDVALSVSVVGTIALPFIILLALGKVQQHEELDR